MTAEGFPAEARKAWHVNRHCDVVLHDGKLCITCQYNGADQCFFITEDCFSAGVIQRHWLEGKSFDDIMSTINPNYVPS